MAKDNPIQLLDLQYRMHPQISLFPAKYIYQGRVKDERCVSYQCLIFRGVITISVEQQVFGDAVQRLHSI